METVKPVTFLSLRTPKFEGYLLCTKNLVCSSSAREVTEEMVIVILFALPRLRDHVNGFYKKYIGDKPTVCAYTKNNLVVILLPVPQYKGLCWAFNTILFDTSHLHGLHKLWTSLSFFLTVPQSIQHPTST